MYALFYEEQIEGEGHAIQVFCGVDLFRHVRGATTSNHIQPPDMRHCQVFLGKH